MLDEAQRQSGSFPNADEDSVRPEPVEGISASCRVAPETVGKGNQTCGGEFPFGIRTAVLTEIADPSKADVRNREVAHMARYWWQCIACGDRPAWLSVCRSRSVAAFIWDELAPSGWDQTLLRRKCKCKRRSLHITYRLRRGDPERVSIKHIVGLAPDGDYLPMLWETFRHSTPRKYWVDFKYQRGRSPWGLTKRLVLQKAQLAHLLRVYERVTSLRIVPRR